MCVALAHDFVVGVSALAGIGHGRHSIELGNCRLGANAVNAEFVRLFFIDTINGIFRRYHVIRPGLLEHGRQHLSLRIEFFHESPPGQVQFALGDDLFNPVNCLVGSKTGFLKPARQIETQDDGQAGRRQPFDGIEERGKTWRKNRPFDFRAKQAGCHSYGTVMIETFRLDAIENMFDRRIGELSSSS